MALGQTRAIHVHAQTMGSGHGTQRRDVIGSIGGAQFRGLGESDGGGLHRVDTGRMRRYRLLQRLRIHAAMRARHQRQTGAGGEELHRTAFIRHDMGA